MAAPSADPVPVQAELLERGYSLWRDAWLRLQKNRIALFGLWTFILISSLCLAGPFFTGYSYESTEISLRASAPLERIVLKTEFRQVGGPRESYLALSSLEDEFLEKSPAERQAVMARV